MTVAQLRDSMTEAEFAQWYAFNAYKEHRARRGGRRGGT